MLYSHHTRLYSTRCRFESFTSSTLYFHERTPFARNAPRANSRNLSTLLCASRDTVTPINRKYSDNAFCPRTPISEDCNTRPPRISFFHRARPLHTRDFTSLFTSPASSVASSRAPSALLAAPASTGRNPRSHHQGRSVDRTRDRRTRVRSTRSSDRENRAVASVFDPNSEDGLPRRRESIAVMTRIVGLGCPPER